MKTKLKYILVASLLFGLSGFNSAKAITADELLVGIQSVIGKVNQIFASIGQALVDHDTRITALEVGTGMDVAVDCISNSAALRNSTLKPGNTYVLTGMCDGPIRITEPAGTYRFRGDATGVKDDGIISQPGQTEDHVISIFGPISANFDNLTISGANYTSQADLDVTTIHVKGNASVSLVNVDAVGGDWGVWADSAYLAIGGDVKITGFREEGLIATNGGHVQVADFIAVEGADNQPGDYSIAMDATRNGSILIGGGGIFTAGTDDGTNVDYERISLSANGNGTVRITGSVPVTLTGTIEVLRSAEVRIKSGGSANRNTLDGDIYASDQSVVRVRYLDQSDGVARASSGSGFIARDSNLSIGASDFINVQAANMTLWNTTVGNSLGTGSINISNYGFLSLLGTTELNGRIINCPDPVQSIQGMATGIGIGSCI